MSTMTRSDVNTNAITMLVTCWRRSRTLNKQIFSLSLLIGEEDPHVLVEASHYDAQYFVLENEFGEVLASYIF